MAKWKGIPVKDIEDQQQHVWNNGSGQVRLEIQTYDGLPHHQLPKLCIEGLHGIPTTMVLGKKGKVCAFKQNQKFTLFSDHNESLLRRQLRD